MSINVSSSITLFIAVFIPTLWTAFFLLLAIAVSFLDNLRFAGLSSLYIKVGLWLFVLVGFLILKFTLMRLKRVDMDEGHMYASNYFKTVRYTYGSIDRVVPIDLGVLTLMKVVLRQKGRFGKTLFFIASKPRLLAAIQQYPKSSRAFGGPSI